MEPNKATNPGHLEFISPEKMERKKTPSRILIDSNQQDRELWWSHPKYKAFVLFTHFTLGSRLPPPTITFSKIILKDPRCRECYQWALVSQIDYLRSHSGTKEGHQKWCWAYHFSYIPIQHLSVYGGSIMVLPEQSLEYFKSLKDFFFLNRSFFMIIALLLYLHLRTLNMLLQITLNIYFTNFRRMRPWHVKRL